jgi:hypothetical protein
MVILDPTPTWAPWKTDRRLIVRLDGHRCLRLDVQRGPLPTVVVCVTNGQLRPWQLKKKLVPGGTLNTMNWVNHVWVAVNLTVHPMLEVRYPSATGATFTR